MTDLPPGPQDVPGAQPPPYGQQPYPQQPYPQQPYPQQPYAQPYGQSQPGWGQQPGYAVPGYAGPGYAYVDPSAPYGRDPLTGAPLSDKSKVAAGLLQLFFGTLGAGRFYTGHTSIAVTQLALTVLGWLLTLVFVGAFIVIGVGVWAFVDAIILLAGRSTDSRGLLLRS